MVLAFLLLVLIVGGTSQVGGVAMPTVPGSHGQLHPRPVLLGMAGPGSPAGRGALALAPDWPDTQARASLTKGSERQQEKGAAATPRWMGNALPSSPGPSRRCPRSELSLSAPSSWRGARPRPLSSLPLKRRARLCGFHSLSTAERERIKSPSRLFSRRPRLRFAFIQNI